MCSVVLWTGTEFPEIHEHKLAKQIWRLLAYQQVWAFVQAMPRLLDKEHQCFHNMLLYFLPELSNPLSHMQGILCHARFFIVLRR